MGKPRYATILTMGQSTTRAFTMGMLTVELLTLTCWIVTAECAQCTGDGGHGSRYTERSYKDGSYLAPANRLFEQLLTGAWGAAEEGW